MMDTVKVIATGSFTTGPEMDALGYPGVWHEHEIREIPLDVWNRIKNGSPLSDDPANLKAYEGAQRGHEVRNQQYREEREAYRLKAVSDYQRNAIDAEVDRMLALEQTEKIAKLRKIAAKKLGFEK